MSLAQQPPLAQHIVFVHGIFNTGAFMRLFARDARRCGFVAYTPTLNRADGRASIRELAKQLQEFIETALPPGEPFYLVGFSMGGIIARYYAQMLDGNVGDENREGKSGDDENREDGRTNPNKRVRRLVAISSPHHGTLMAWLLPLAGARDLRAGSECLCVLQETECRLQGLSILALHTPFDIMIVPFTRSIWRSEYLNVSNRRVYVPFHALMPFVPSVRAVVMRFLGAALQSGVNVPQSEGKARKNQRRA